MFCLSLLLILSATVSTMNSGTLIGAFGMADCDVVISNVDMEFLTGGGREKLKESLDDLVITIQIKISPQILHTHFRYDIM